MLTNTQLLAIAKKQIGNGGSKYRSYVHASGNYCNMFVYWLYNANGCASLLPLPKSNYMRTYCPSSIKWCRKNLAEIPPYLAMACDIIYMDWEPNGVPNHIGIVEEKISTDAIKTIEGNTTGKRNGKTVSGIVAAKTRNTKYTTIFRPHFAPPKTLKKHKLKVDGDFSWNSVYMFQVVLGMTPTGILTKETVQKFQRLINCKPDGAWGKKTSLGAQNFLKKHGCYHGKLDSEFGEQSVRALQTWINKKAYPNTKNGASSVTKQTDVDKKKTTESKKTETSAQKSTLKSYRIDIDITNQIATVYGVYSNGSSKALMSEFVSTARKGKSTPTGNFKISGASGGRKAKLRTAKMSSGKSYAEYLCRFHGAKCMHTVPYKKRNTKGLVNKVEFNKLGKPASAGCVRMPYKLAKFIYMNCPVGTPVVVLKGKKGEYPMGKPKKYTAKAVKVNGKTLYVDPTK